MQGSALGADTQGSGERGHVIGHTQADQGSGLAETQHIMCGTIGSEDFGPVIQRHDRCGAGLHQDAQLVLSFFPQLFFQLEARVGGEDRTSVVAGFAHQQARTAIGQQRHQEIEEEGDRGHPGNEDAASNRAQYSRKQRLPAIEHSCRHHHGQDIEKFERVFQVLEPFERQHHAQ